MWEWTWASKQRLRTTEDRRTCKRRWKGCILVATLHKRGVASLLRTRNSQNPIGLGVSLRLRPPAFTRVLPRFMALGALSVPKPRRPLPSRNSVSIPCMPIPLPVSISISTSIPIPIPIFIPMPVPVSRALVLLAEKAPSPSRPSSRAWITTITTTIIIIIIAVVINITIIIIIIIIIITFSIVSRCRRQAVLCGGHSQAKRRATGNHLHPASTDLHLATRLTEALSNGLTASRITRPRQQNEHH
ncbi:hypothetical protein K431DRAFT_332053 [Polychaeton citri CBS 116435]|uniref:Uncharacterized protein n=1 Tax=Polychaeton citri CBS 116435 TaxID=1314669 RepID=A0A9P4UMH4_9PEZI|nr:hypothetical protein K431DRAFT_332053 [Polychaeton citri CBS 116435]